MEQAEKLSTARLFEIANTYRLPEDARRKLLKAAFETKPKTAYDAFILYTNIMDKTGMETDPDTFEAAVVNLKVFLVNLTRLERLICRTE